MSEARSRCKIPADGPGIPSREEGVCLTYASVLKIKRLIESIDSRPRSRGLQRVAGRFGGLRQPKR